MRLLLILAIILSFACSTSCTTNIYNSAPEIVTDYNIGTVYRSVALLSIKSPSGGGIAATGFAYDKDHILTAGHFCVDALKIQIFESHEEDIKIQYYDDDYNTVTKSNVKVADISRVQDLCMLKKENHGLWPLKIVKKYNKVKIRDRVTIVGAPMGVIIGEFEGRVMSLFYNGRDPKGLLKNKLVVSSASTNGISGSPIILNRTGEVIGVLVMGHIFFDHLSFGVNGKDLNVFIKDF